MRRVAELEREVIFLRAICALVSAIAVLAIVSLHLKPHTS